MIRDDIRCIWLKIHAFFHILHPLLDITYCVIKLRRVCMTSSVYIDFHFSCVVLFLYIFPMDVMSWYIINGISVVTNPVSCLLRWYCCQLVLHQQDHSSTTKAMIIYWVSLIITQFFLCINNCTKRDHCDRSKLLDIWDITIFCEDFHDYRGQIHSKYSHQRERLNICINYIHF